METRRISLLVWPLFALSAVPISHALPAVSAHPGVEQVADDPVRQGTLQSVRDMDGVSHDLAARVAAGKMVALVFWQTWCQSCQREAPEIVAAAQALGADVEFYGIVPGPDEFVDDDEVRQVALEWGYPFPQVRDRDLGLTRAFRVSGTPTIIVLGPGGRITYRGRRSPDDWAAVTGPATQ